MVILKAVSWSSCGKADDIALSGNALLSSVTAIGGTTSCSSQSYNSCAGILHFPSSGRKRQKEKYAQGGGIWACQGSCAQCAYYRQSKRVSGWRKLKAESRDKPDTTRLPIPRSGTSICVISFSSYHTGESQRKGEGG